MKYIVYQIEGYMNQYNPETTQIDQVLSTATVRVEYSEETLTKIKAEAYNGEYTIEDDGQPDPKKESTADEILDILLGVVK